MLFRNLLRFGKKPWPDFTCLPYPGRRRVIECIGIPGVGKSKLVQDYLNACSRTTKILPPTAIHTHKMTSDLVPGELSAAHAYLWAHLMAEFKLAPSGNNPLSARLNHACYMVRADNRVRRSEDPTPVLLDEGVIHNCSLAIRKMCREKPELANEVLRDRRVIYCVTNLERLFANLKKRQVDSNALTRSAAETVTILKNYHDYAAFLIENGVPVLELPTHLDSKEKIVRIRTFLCEADSKDTNR